MDITALLKFTIDNKASDLHLSGGNQPIVRIDGDLQRIKTDVLTGDMIRSMLSGTFFPLSMELVTAMS